MIQDIPLPHSAEMERAILSCYLQKPERVSDEVSGLTVDDFYIPMHRTLFRACRALSEISLDWDLTVLGNYLYEHAKEVYDGMGMDGLRALRNEVATIAALPRYLPEVMNCGIARRLINMCSDFQGEAAEAPASEIPQLVERLQKATADVAASRSDTGFLHISDSLTGAVEDIAGIARRDPDFVGIPTGFRGLDQLLLGIKPGEVVVVAARPSIGKTAFALCMLRRMAGFGYPSGIITLEMSAQALTRRHLFEEALVNPRMIYHGRMPTEEWSPRINAAAERLRKIPMYHYDASNKWPDIRRRARQEAARSGLRILAIDYLQIMRYGGTAYSREHEVARLSGEIKALARELNIPIMVLAQLNRSAEGKRPQLSELRESGAIEQDADIVAMLHRARQTDDPEIMEAISRGEGIATEVIIHKNRDGATGAEDLLFFPQYTRFDEPHYTKEDTF